MKTGHTWRGVPLEKIEEWTAIFNASHEGINLSTSCPVCGASTLHRYYQLGKPIDRIINDMQFVAEGSSWEWCSTCKSYDHGRSLVPEWWSTSIKVDTAQLTAEPEVLEVALHNDINRHSSISKSSENL